VIMGNTASSSSQAGAVKGGNAAGEPVYVSLYEPAKGSPGVPGFNVFHSGVELYGTEYCYAGGPDFPPSVSGIQTQTPRVSPDSSQWVYKESLLLGKTTLSSSQLRDVLRKLESDYPARDYHVVHRNCNQFSGELAKQLGCTFPSHINRAAEWGKWLIDNPIDDRKRREAEKAAEEARKKNVFANSTGYSLANGAPVKPKPGTTASTATGTGTGTGTGSSSGTGVGPKKNPWADPNFMPGKAKAANNQRA